MDTFMNSLRWETLVMARMKINITHTTAHTTGFLQKLINQIQGVFKHYFFGFQGLKSEISLIKPYRYYLSNSNKLIKQTGMNKVQHKSMQ